MSISGVTSASSYPVNQQDSQRQNLLALTKALDSGDLSGAQQAYSALTDSQNGSGIDANSPLGQGLAQIGQALQAGDLDAAQQGLSAMRSQVRGHHHHHHAAAPSQKPEQPAAGAAGQTSSNNVLDIKV